MSTSLKYIFLFLIVVLFGVSVYLGYLYKLESGKLATPEIFTQPTVLTGRVLSGYNIPSEKTYCFDKNYLVSEGREPVWLIDQFALKDARTKSFSEHSYSQIEVSGSYGQSSTACFNDTDPCECGEVMVVESLTVMKEGKEFASGYVGEIVCAIETVDANGVKSCIYGLKSEGSDAVRTLTALPGSPNFGGFIGAKVKVLGVLNNNTIDVFEIEKVE